MTGCCPIGRDAHMCAYCEYKDTCPHRCDEPKPDVIWGDITGDLEADQTDLTNYVEKKIQSSLETIEAIPVEYINSLKQ